MLIEANFENTLPLFSVEEENNLVTLRGRSISLEANEFFEEILEYLKTYLDYKLKNITFILDLEYFNTSTSRMLVNMFKLVKTLAEKHEYSVLVKWYTEYNDDEMMTAGADFQYVTALPFEFIEKEKKDE